jgi:Ca2+-binding EF-hand superfamily protein
MTDSRKSRDTIVKKFLSITENEATTDFSRQTISDLLNIMTEELQLEKASDDEVFDLFRELDINGNGKLSKEEIKVFTKQLVDIVSNYALLEKNDRKSNAGSKE